MKSAILSLIVVTLAMSLFGQAPDSTRMDDNSDWWSFLSRDDGALPDPSRTRTPTASFRILGISLFDDDVFESATKRLGKAPIVDRGDASTGRHQLCYASLDGTIHLIFEIGEVDTVLYVFDAGPSWKGIEYCLRSRAVTKDVATLSGLHLGMTRAEVRKILGVPSRSTKNTLIYSRETRKRMPPKLLEGIRRNDPNHYSDEEFHRNFDFYDETVHIEARFIRSKLAYLAVSQSGTT